MILSFKVLDNVVGVNSFSECSSYTHVNSNSNSVLYLRMFNDIMRNIPSATATVEVSILGLNSQAATRVASFPFTEDRSIISIPILANETLSNNCLKVILKDGANSIELVSKTMFVVYKDKGYC